MKSRKKRLTKRQREYAEMLRDPRWQKLRLEVLSAAEWKCSWCHREDKNLQIHHGFYGKGEDDQSLAPFEYPVSSLHVLCEHCHKQSESLRAQVYEALGRLAPKYHHHVFYGIQRLLEELDQGREVEQLEPWKP